MWIAKEIANKSNSSSVIGARMRDGNIVGEYSDEKLPFLFPYGIQSVPANEKSLMILDSGSGRVCAGVVDYLGDNVPGEVRIFSLGGAYINLDLQGNVTINGLVITKDGKILQKGEIK